MPEKFVVFHLFSDEEDAKDFAQDLERADIEFTTEAVGTILDSNIIGSQASPAITIKLRPTDFEKAHTALGEYYKKLTDRVSNDYYLFGFSDNELIEILAKRDEWGYFDYQLAQKILAERGHKIDSASIERLRKTRIDELAKPEKDGLLLILLGYAFLAATAWASRSILWDEPNLFPFSFILSLFFGRHLAHNKKILPDGQVVYSYKKSDREHGRAIITITLFLLALAIGAWLYHSPFFDTNP